ncbi:uncharacterized protein KNAG_0J02260 [Huiozyma naganishii CBS 8797]|uniref:DBF4-type domain-containing protein n=1 Tax=Huiozyma naganishii (strain ATCC MYA-139 / BCRC 22969 / CBS 8797 / KCTC 17520 / NBRC 10181 / NCYC 3082 / Yp74L-3) TaxID=1071383 RepID=J7S2Y3_HUIN7|nr:hypothetical protein KNAG_0J02260 [Kazachstania naganishii CBS 8797]CCK72307.1 hypothetical protein KNAG_0J02260 [Kazachstania naganishii CBS 8797]
MDGELDEQVVDILRANKSIEDFIKSGKSSQLICEGDTILEGSISNDSFKTKTKWDSLIEWQREWRGKLRDRRTNLVHLNENVPKKTPLTVKKNYAKQRLIYKKKFQKFGAEVVPTFHSKVNFLVLNTDADTKPIIKNPTVKIWNLDKTSRFFQRLEIDAKKMATAEEDEIGERNSDVQYFDKDPHVYLYDILQDYRPLICLRWTIEELNSKDDLPYPTLTSLGSYGACPFNRRNKSSETNHNTVRKRYLRDAFNKKYARKLKILYQKQAKPAESLLPAHYDEVACLEIPHNSRDSSKLFNELESRMLKRRQSSNFKFMSFTERDDGMVRMKADTGVTRDELADIYEEDDSDDDRYTNSTSETEAGSDEKPLSSSCNFQTRTDLVNGVNASIHTISDTKCVELSSAPKEYNYCENCSMKYNDLKEHRNTVSHTEFSNDNSKFAVLDAFLSRFVKS